MKKAILAVMIFCSLIENFSRGLIYAAFELNRDYISKNLCIERETEANCCQGACYLNEKLDEAEEKKSGKNFRFVEHADLFIIQLYSGILFSAPDLPAEAVGGFNPRQEVYICQLYQDIFRPPRFI